MKHTVLALLITVGLFSLMMYTVYFAMYHQDLLQTVGLGAGFVAITIMVFHWIKTGLSAMSKEEKEADEDVSP